MKKAIALLLALVMCLCLCACGKASDYEAAVSLMDAGSYEEAITAFAELGDYEDSSQKLAECENVVSYSKALALFESGEFEDALAIFSTLGDYQDSAEKKVECENEIAYNEAIALIEAGQYQEARVIFQRIPEHEDVTDYLARYKTIEITPENWEEYFMTVQNPRWQENAFGEGELWAIEYCLTLKDEYASKLVTANVAMGFSSNWSAYRIEIDAVNFLYTITDQIVWDWGNTDTSTITFTESSNIEELVVDHCEVYHDDQEGFWYVYNPNKITLDRAKGSIEIFQ